MSRTSKVLAIAGSCLLVLMAVVYIQGKYTGEGKSTAITPVQDLANHPVYGKYPFGQANNVIDVGMQPLSLTIGVIAGVMKRDAILKKALSEQGLEIRFHPFFKGADINFFLKRGNLDAAMAGDMPALTAASVSDVIVASLTRLGFNSIVAGKHMLIKDLRGKRIGYASGSTAHHNILQALSSAGLRDTSVHLTQLKVTEMPDALAQGKIDAFVAWEPTPTIALARFDDFVVIHRSLVSTYLYFLRSLIDQHPKAVRQIIGAQLRSIAWMKYRERNLQEACSWAAQEIKDLTGQKTLLSGDQCASLVKSDLLDILPVPIIPEKDLVINGRLFKEFKFLKNLGKIHATTDWSKVQASFDRTIIEEVLSEANKYQLNIYEYLNEGIRENASK